MLALRSNAAVFWDAGISAVCSWDPRQYVNESVDDQEWKRNGHEQKHCCSSNRSCNYVGRHIYVDPVRCSRIQWFSEEKANVSIRNHERRSPEEYPNCHDEEQENRRRCDEIGLKWIRRIDFHKRRFRFRRKANGLVCHDGKEGVDIDFNSIKWLKQTSTKNEQTCRLGFWSVGWSTYPYGA